MTCTWALLRPQGIVAFASSHTQLGETIFEVPFLNSMHLEIHQKLEIFVPTVNWACLDIGADGGRIRGESQLYLLFSPVGILEEFEETVSANEKKNVAYIF